MFDTFKREIYYLRLSVTDLCNLRCKYCMPGSGVTKLEHADILSVEEIEEIVKATAKCGIKKVRVTGGEPLVRKGIVDICERIAAIKEIEEVCMTTNGLLLEKYAKDLKKAGLDRLNISLDTLDEKKYSDMTRGGKLKDVLRGIEASEAAGFENLKLNVVLIGGYNDDEIVDFVNLTRKNKIQVRFIELMPIGQCTTWEENAFLSAEMVLNKVDGLELQKVDGVATLYKLKDAKGSIGLIRPMSNHFCPSCNRIRITSDGKLKTCLHSENEILIRGLTGEVLEDTLKSAILQKPQMFNLSTECHSESKRFMNQIGG